VRSAQAESYDDRQHVTENCVPSFERPYVCDVGDPKPVSMRSFREILQNNEAIRSTVERIGMPDWVEIQQVDVDAPWGAWEIRTYFRRYNRVMAFSRAFILEYPEISLLRYQGPIPASKRWPEVHTVAVSSTDDSLARAERAAAEAEAIADRAEREAARAEAIANTSSEDFKRGLVKH
jgi:hypothetical protein